MPIEKLYVINSRDVDATCKDISDLHIAGKLELKSLLATAVPVTSLINGQPSLIFVNKDTHVVNGEKAIQDLHLTYFNNKLYTYEKGVYTVISDAKIRSYIVRNIDINATDTNCNKSISFIYNWLLNDEIKRPDSNYINYKNGIYDIKNNKLISHTPDIFTVNQLSINYLEELPENSLVEHYLDELMNHECPRTQGLLEILGYCQTTNTDIQKAFIFLGNGANGKSEYCKLIEKIFGENNVSRVDLQTFGKQFGTHEIENKLLNIVSDLPLKTLTETGTFKALTSRRSYNV